MQEKGTTNQTNRPHGPGYVVLSTEYSVLASSRLSQKARERVSAALILAALMAMVISIVFASPAGAADRLTDANAVQAGKEALSGSARFPWYDRSQDRSRRLNVVPRDTLGRGRGLACLAPPSSGLASRCW
jgi:hypothetical protein